MSIFNVDSDVWICIPGKGTRQGIVTEVDPTRSGQYRVSCTKPATVGNIEDDAWWSLDYDYLRPLAAGPLLCDEEQGLLIAIRRERGDSTARGAYSDWLREHGRNEEADAHQVPWIVTEEEPGEGDEVQVKLKTQPKYLNQLIYGVVAYTSESRAVFVERFRTTGVPLVRGWYC